MQDKINSLESNETWELVEPFQNAIILRDRWVYKLKKDSIGNIAKYKAQWVAKSFEQTYKVDFKEVFASVVKSATFKALFTLVIQFNL
jgi:hypothetical protein